MKQVHVLALFIFVKVNLLLRHGNPLQRCAPSCTPESRFCFFAAADILSRKSHQGDGCVPHLFQGHLTSNDEDKPDKQKKEQAAMLLLDPKKGSTIQPTLMASKRVAPFTKLLLLLLLSRVQLIT